MRIGIICEGRSDLAVIRNILKGATGIDTNNFVALVPVMDNTSKAHLNPDTHSSWTVVVNECKEKQKINRFFSQKDSTHIVVHLDTAEAKEYGIEIPKVDDKEYCAKLRQQVKDKINELLGEGYSDKTLYAIAIQEIDSWVVAIYERKNSCMERDAKKAFQKVLKKTDFRYKEGYDSYEAYSYDFRNSNKTKREGYLSYNCSLQLFWEEAEQKLVEK